MNEGQNIVIYPEGGVPDDTSIVLDEFKDGAFTLSSKHHFLLLYILL
jgi:1-acyl-sn-glycerol-3-phosphate acyltransferase